jgi:acyl-[acyl carrier protein]--UDP-N-acetylglucosamine O-acyltransferase
VASDASLNSNIFINGNTTINKTLYVASDASLNSNVFINGNTTINKTLYVASDASLNSNVFINGDTTINKTLYVASDVSLNGNLYVNKNSVISGDLTVTGRFLSGVTVSSFPEIVVGNINTFSNGELYIAQSNRGNQNINIGGSSTDHTYINGKLTVTGLTVYEGTRLLESKIFNIFDSSGLPQYASAGAGITIGENGCQTAGTIIISKDLNGYILQPTYGANNTNTINTVSNRLFMNINSMTLPSTITTGIMTITRSTNYTLGFVTNKTPNSDYTMSVGTLDVGNIFLKNTKMDTQYISSNISISGNTFITNILDSTSTLSGALIVSGGIGVSGNVNMGNLFIKSVIESTGVDTGSLQITGGMYVGGNSYIRRNMYIGSSGSQHANTILDVSGNAIVSKLGIGTTSVNSTYTLDISGSANIKNGNITMTSNNGYIVQF